MQLFVVIQWAKVRLGYHVICTLSCSLTCKCTLSQC